jgi:histidine ammonia-lyase
LVLGLAILVDLGLCPDFMVFRRVLSGERVLVGEGLVRALDTARSALESEASKRRVYGYCSGLGALMDKSGVCSPEWEHRVLVEHAVGVGPLAPPEVSRLFLFIRLLQMSQGLDPVRGLLALRIADALNSDITPLIPVRGSLGASGDLAPSAHAFLCIFRGVGMALHRGSRVECSEALRSESLDVVDLKPGEALALVNNTSWSTALLAYSILRLEDAMSRSLKVARSSLELCRCVEEHYGALVSKIKRHPGVSAALKALDELRCSNTSRLQDPYSLRCTPYIYGAVLDLIELSKDIVLREACSTTTNPVVVDGRVVHSCAFYSIHTAVIADMLAVGAAHVANAIERRITQLLRGDITGLPDFLAEGTPVGSMIDSYVATSITARLRALATPHSVHSLPVSGLQEDVVPHAGEASLRLVEVVELLGELIGIEERVVVKALSLKQNRSS